MSRRRSVPPSREVMSAEQRQDQPITRTCSITRRSFVKLVLLLVLVASPEIVFGLVFKQHVVAGLQWVDDHRVPGAFIFVALYTLVTTIFFPSSLLTLAGGFIFGVGGIPLVWIGAVAGQTGSFFVSRYLLRSWVSTWGEKYPAWSAVDAAVREQALKIVILLRLATVMPYSVTNALLPITGITFVNYTIGSAVGIIPGVILFTLIGTLATSVADVVSGNVGANSTVLIASIVVSIVMLAIVVVLLTRYAKKALAEQAAAAEAATHEAAAVEGVGSTRSAIVPFELGGEADAELMSMGSIEEEAAPLLEVQ